VSNISIQTLTGGQEIIPDPAVPTFRLLTQRDPATGTMGIFQSSDAGTTWIPLLPVPSRQTRPGCVLTLDSAGQAAWLPLSTNPTVPSRTTLPPPLFVEFLLEGTTTAGIGFGYFRVPDDLRCRLIEVQHFIHTAATAPVIVLIQDTPATQSIQSSLAANATHSRTKFGTPLILQGGTNWSAKILSAPSPGSTLSVRLVLQPF